MHAPTVNAPFVPQSPSFMECRYVKTVKIPAIFKNDSMYSLIIGEVVNIHIRRDCLKHKTGTAKGDDDGGSDDEECFDLAIDLEKVRPVSRLGYGQEYTVLHRPKQTWCPYVLLAIPAL
jgi:flavin reductase (DIM6/NTAB) family NADH-FMN oxidoreductase RutF